MLEERKEVILPSALELSKADQSCLGSGSPNVIAFLGKFYAKQISEVNTKKTWVKHGLARWSTDVNTIPYQRRTSEMIRQILCIIIDSLCFISSISFRDEYVLEVKNFFKSKERENMLKDHKYLNRKRDAKLLKYRYEVHPTASIALEFVLPNIVRGGFCNV